MTGGVKGQVLMTEYSREIVNMQHKLKLQVNVAEFSWHLLPGFSSVQHGRNRFPYSLIAAVYSLHFSSYSFDSSGLKSIPAPPL